MDKHQLERLIAGYLRDRGFNSTLEEFLQECNDRDITISQSNSWSQHGQDSVQSDLLVSFECGEREAFFTTWSNMISGSLLDNESTCQNLEFSLAVYFAVYPFRYKIRDTQPAMTWFLNYLSSRGQLLECSPDLTVYCALPYIPDPSSHNSFKHLFTESWNKELRSRLEQFLELSLVGRASHETMPTTLLKQLQGLPHHVVPESVLARQKLEELQASYHTLAGIAIELVEALETAVTGNNLDPNYIQDMCVRLYQASAAPPTLAPPISQTDTSASVLQASIMSLRQSIQTPLLSAHKLSPLDYSRLKRDILVLPSSSKVLILNALRWRLSHATSLPHRGSVLMDYTINDILSLNEDNNLIERLFSSGDDKVIEALCRFLNGLSSLRVGRDYLQSSQTLVQLLCSLLTSLHDDTPLMKNLLGTVQKLSLRRPLQSQMISCHVIKWTVQILSNAADISDYTLRYALALLMNLCLKQEGKQYCISILPTPLQVLCDILEHDNVEVRSYVNGILYSIFEKKEIREAAVNLDVVEMLHSAMSDSSPDLQSQLQFILNRFDSNTNNDQGAEASLEQDSEEDEESDPEIIDGDEDEPPDLMTNGEDILKDYYLSRDSVQSVPVDTEPLMKPVIPPFKPTVFQTRPISANGHIAGPLTKSIKIDNRPKTSTS